MKVTFYFPEMVIDMLGSILEIKFMVLVFITLLMAIAMRVLGMKVVNKDMGCMLLEMVM